MALLRRIRRLAVCFVWMWPYGLWSLIHAIGGRAGIRRVAYFTRGWGRFLVRHVAPIEVKLRGNRSIAPGSLIVSNHQSYIDILVHASLFPIPRRRSVTGPSSAGIWPSAVRSGSTANPARNPWPS